MKPTVRDWIWQTVGLIVGLVPAIFATFTFPFGLLVYAVACVGFIHPRSRSFTFGFVCAVLTVPGILGGALLFN